MVSYMRRHAIAGPWAAGERVLANLERKAAQADRMFTALTEHMREAQAVRRAETYDRKAEVPSWVTS